MQEGRKRQAAADTVVAGLAAHRPEFPLAAQQGFQLCGSEQAQRAQGEDLHTKGGRGSASPKNLKAQERCLSSPHKPNQLEQQMSE
jgi:hypothetical protein